MASANDGKVIMNIVSDPITFWHFSLYGRWLSMIQIRYGSIVAKLDIVKLVWLVWLIRRKYISTHKVLEVLTNSLLNISGSDTLDLFKSAASKVNGQSVPATAQGGILGTPSAGQTTTTSSSNTATSGPSTTSSMTTTSSTSPASGTNTSTGGSSPSATNTAENLHVSDLSVLAILTLTMAIFLI
jgi:hypothetical protein